MHGGICTLTNQSTSNSDEDFNPIDEGGADEECIGTFSLEHLQMSSAKFLMGTKEKYKLTQVALLQEMVNPFPRKQVESCTKKV